MAVYTDVNDEELQSFIAGYGLGEVLSYKGIAEGVENTNYLVVTTAGTYILTLYEKRVSVEDLPFFLSLKQHLHSRGVNCPLPVAAKDGRVLSELAGRAAVLITFLDGISVKNPKPQHCAEVGQALAALHLAGQGFPMQRANALGVAGWRPLFEKFKADADQITPGLQKLIAQELATVEGQWPRGLPEGIVHADLFPDNVFFLGDRLTGLIDFYFACNDAFAYDLAICVNAWCFDPDHAFNPDKGAALLGSYDAVRPLTAEEQAAFPTLARGAALRFLLTRSYDWLNTPKDALVRPHNPLDYVARVQFHQAQTAIEGYGFGASA